MGSSDKPPDFLQGFMEKVFAANRDLDEAYRFLIPTIGGKALEPRQEQSGRKALARLLRNDELLLDRGLRHMLAAVFDSDRARNVGADDVAAGYAWLAGERVATLKFRTGKTRRKSPLKDFFIASAIAERRRTKKISIEKAAAEIAELLGIGYGTAEAAWKKVSPFWKG
jgi:hypothetical protein